MQAKQAILAIATAACTAASIAFGMASTAHAIALHVDMGTITIIGPSVGTLANSPTPAFAQFQLGERVFGVIEFDETLPDLNTNANNGNYFDPSANFQFTGQTTGTSYSFQTTLNIMVRDDRIVFNTEPESPSPTEPLGFINNLRVFPGDDFFTMPKDLAFSINEFLTKPYVDEATNETTVPGFWDPVSMDKRRGIVILRDGGPITAAASVPVPATLLLMSGALAALGLRGSSRH